LLTDKEKRLLKTLANSRDANANKTLAYEYNVTVQAVKNEFSNIFVKLGARNRIQAAVFEFLRPKPEGESGEEANSLLPEVQDVFVEEITA
jgi:DNA-binding NarL/FixJ family response regulator